jgi:hypothetical protein
MGKLKSSSIATEEESAPLLRGTEVLNKRRQAQTSKETLAFYYIRMLSARNVE